MRKNNNKIAGSNTGSSQIVGSADVKDCGSQTAARTNRKNNHEEKIPQEEHKIGPGDMTKKRRKAPQFHDSKESWDRDEADTASLTDMLALNRFVAEIRVMIHGKIEEQEREALVVARNDFERRAYVRSNPTLQNERTMLKEVAHKTNSHSKGDFREVARRKGDEFLNLYDKCLKDSSVEQDLFLDCLMHDCSLLTCALAAKLKAHSTQSLAMTALNQGVELRNGDLSSPHMMLVLYSKEQGERILSGENLLKILSFIDPRKLSVRQERQPFKIVLSTGGIVFFAEAEALIKQLVGWWMRDVPNDERKQRIIKGAIVRSVYGGDRGSQIHRIKLDPSVDEIAMNWGGLSIGVIASWVLAGELGEPAIQYAINRCILRCFLDNGYAHDTTLKTFAKECEFRAQDGSDPAWPSHAITPYLPEATEQRLLVMAKWQRVPMHDTLAISGSDRITVISNFIRCLDDPCTLIDGYSDLKQTGEDMLELVPQLTEFLQKILRNAVDTDAIESRRNYPYPFNTSAGMAISESSGGQIAEAISVAMARYYAGSEFVKSKKIFRKFLFSNFQRTLKEVVSWKKRPDRAFEMPGKGVDHERFLGFVLRELAEYIRPIYQHRKCRNASCEFPHLHPRMWVDPHVFWREGKKRILGRIDAILMVFFRMFSVLCGKYALQLPGQTEVSTGLDNRVFDRLSRFVKKTKEKDLNIENFDASKSTDGILAKISDWILIPAGKEIDKHLSSELREKMAQLQMTFEGIAEMHNMPVQVHGLRSNRQTMNPFLEQMADSKEQVPKLKEILKERDTSLSWETAIQGSGLPMCTPIFEDPLPLVWYAADDLRLANPTQKVVSLLSCDVIMRRLPCLDVLPEFLDALLNIPVLVKAPTGSGKTSILLAGCILAFPGVTIISVPTKIAADVAKQRLAFLFEQLKIQVRIKVVYQRLNVEYSKYNGERVIICTPYHPSILINQLPVTTKVALIIDEPEQYPNVAELLRRFSYKAGNVRLAAMSATLDPEWVPYWRGLNVDAHSIVVKEQPLAADDGPLWEGNVSSFSELNSKLIEWIEEYPGRLALIFCRDRMEMKDIHFGIQEVLVEQRIQVDYLHGARRREAIDRILNYKGKKAIILCTDIAATSVTLPDVTLVVNDTYKRSGAFDPINQTSSLNVFRASPTTLKQRKGRVHRARNKEGALHKAMYLIFHRRVMAGRSEVRHVPMEPKASVGLDPMGSHPLGYECLEISTGMSNMQKLHAGLLRSNSPRSQWRSPKMSPWIEAICAELNDEDMITGLPAHVFDCIMMICAVSAKEAWGTAWREEDEATELPLRIQESVAMINKRMRQAKSVMDNVGKLSILGELHPSDPKLKTLNGDYLQVVYQYRRIRSVYFVVPEDGIASASGSVTKEDIAKVIGPPLRKHPMFWCLVQDDLRLETLYNKVDVMHTLDVEPGEYYFLIPPWNQSSAVAVSGTLLYVGTDPPADFETPSLILTHSEVKTPLIRPHSVSFMDEDAVLAVLATRLDPKLRAETWLRQYQENLEAMSFQVDNISLVSYAANQASPMTGKVLQSANYFWRRAIFFLKNRINEIKIPEESHLAASFTALREMKYGEMTISLGYGDDVTMIRRPELQPIIHAVRAIIPFIAGPGTVIAPLRTNGKYHKASVYFTERSWELSGSDFVPRPNFKVGTCTRLLIPLLCDVLPILHQSVRDVNALHASMPRECVCFDQQVDVAQLPELAARLYNNKSIDSLITSEIGDRIQDVFRDFEIPEQVGSQRQRVNKSLFDLTADVLGDHISEDEDVAFEQRLMLVHQLRILHINKFLQKGR